MRTAFITGITGQDGAWLAKYLIELGYKVYGGVRRTSTKNMWRLEYLDILNKVILTEFDLLDYSNIFSLIRDIQPDEFYNLAAQSFVGTSFKQPISTGLQDGMAVAYILDVIKTVSPKTKFYQASTSEMYGKVQEIPQNEQTPFYPRSPYGCAKLYAHWMTVNYRESYNLFTVSGILFNHESELRGSEFVTRKITTHVARFKYGDNSVLELGNLDAQRDWGYAKEYVEGMHLMLQQDKPDDFILSTGKTTKIRDFVENAYAVIDKKITWEGSGIDEIGKDSLTGKVLIRVNSEYYRPAEVDLLIGNGQKAKDILGWQAKTTIQDLCEIMVKSDLDSISK